MNAPVFGGVPIDLIIHGNNFTYPGFGSSLRVGGGTMTGVDITVSLGAVAATITGLNIDAAAF